MDSERFTGYCNRNPCSGNGRLYYLMFVAYVMSENLGIFKLLHKVLECAGKGH